MNWITMLKRLLKPGLLITILILLFAYNYTGIGIIILVIYFIDNFHQLNYYLEKESDFNQFIKSINKGISENALKSIYPLVLIKEDGEIVWYNNLFNTLKSDEENTEKNILSIARGINLDDFLKNENNLHQRLSIQNKLYDVYATLIETKNKKNLYLLSFNDITKLIDYETTQESVMLIEVDNFTEVIDKTDDNNRPLLVAEIERTINTYANNLKAMIKRYDTNKYVLSIQDKYIEDEIKHKFNIMEVISKIDKGNSIEITLSIGVGRGGMSPLENHNNAI